MLRCRYRASRWAAGRVSGVQSATTESWLLVNGGPMGGGKRLHRGRLSPEKILEQDFFENALVSKKLREESVRERINLSARNHKAQNQVPIEPQFSVQQSKSFQYLLLWKWWCALSYSSCSFMLKTRKRTIYQADLISTNMPIQVLIHLHFCDFSWRRASRLWSWNSRRSSRSTSWSSSGGSQSLSIWSSAHSAGRLPDKRSVINPGLVFWSCFHCFKVQRFVNL